MDVRAALRSQYHAALKTLRDVIEKCPDKAWNDGPAPVWRVAYHTLYFANMYLKQSEAAFSPWQRHREEAQYISSVPSEGRPPKACEPFTRQEVLEYLNVCDTLVDGCIDALDLSAEKCGFPRYEMSTLEHQIVNIRHIQHHAAALSNRLRQSAGVAVDWVRKG
jgi:hypothetical protein